MTKSATLSAVATTGLILALITILVVAPRPSMAWSDSRPTQAASPTGTCSGSVATHGWDYMECVAGVGNPPDPYTSACLWYRVGSAGTESVPASQCTKVGCTGFNGKNFCNPPGDGWRFATNPSQGHVYLGGGR